MWCAGVRIGTHSVFSYLTHDKIDHDGQKRNKQQTANNANNDDLQWLDRQKILTMLGTFTNTEKRPRHHDEGAQQ
jgi:hypothetical protein